MDIALAARADEAEARASADFFRAAPPALASRLGLRVEHHAGATVLLAAHLPAATFNRVIGAGVHQRAQPQDLDHWLARLAAAGAQPGWVHLAPGAQPAELADWLAQRGLTPAARRAWVKLWRGTAAAPSVASSLHIAPTTPETLAATAQAIVAAFEMPSAVAEWIGALHGRSRWTLYSVLDGQQPVGGGALYLDDGSAWLGMAGVLASHRNRGGQGALMARRIADALAAGSHSLYTETGEPVGQEANPSLTNMLRCGFSPVMSRLNLRTPPPEGRSS